MQNLDLFSGIGGFALGLERVGIPTTMFCEIDPYCRKVLNRHWPTVPIIEDVRSLHINKNQFDIICGGFPCQDISVAGKQKGLSGKRSSLWYEFLRLIQEGEPKYVIIENVANLRNKGLSIILKNLYEVGYDAEWHIISASALGFPQMRERLWVIAYPRSQGLQGCTLNKYTLPICNKQKKSEFGNSSIPIGLEKQSFSEFIRMGDGIPVELDKNRLVALGNSIIPEIVEHIGKAILYRENL